MQFTNQDKPAYYYMQAINQLHALSGHEPLDRGQKQSILVVITEGAANFYWDEQTYRLQAGNIAHFQHGEKLTCVGSTELCGYWISYSELDFNACSVSPFQDGLLLLQASMRLIQLIEQSYKTWHTDASTNPFAIQQLFANILFQLHNELQLQHHKKDYWLPEIVAYIEQHYNTDISRSELAKLANVTPEHFSRVFHKETGHTYSAYVNLLRIRKSQQLMLTVSSQLSQIANILGYEESSYFSRKFKQIVGISPAAYKRKEKIVVSLNYNYTGCLRALNVLPELASYSDWQERTLNTSSRHKLLLPDSDYEAIAEAVAAIKPDVVLSYASLPINSYLMSIAPVIEIPFRQLSWKEQFLLISDVVNRREQAEQWLHAFQLKTIDTKNKLEQQLIAHSSVIVWEFGREHVYCFAPSYGRACQFLYDELGFTMPEVLKQQAIFEKGFVEVTIDQLVNYDADVLIFVNNPRQQQARQQFKLMLDSAQWQALQAVRHNHIYFLNEPDLFYGFDPLSTLAQLKFIDQALTS